MRVYVQFDIEGIAGLVQRDNRDVDDPRVMEWRMRMRRIATREVSAVVQGCFQAGASSVVVWDSHGSGHNLLVEELHPDAELITGDYHRGPWLPFFDNVDVGIYVGAHAMAGTPRAIIPHTLVTLNGRDYGEGGMFIVEAGSLGIPVVLLSGDRAAVEESRPLIPTAEFVITKDAIGPTLAKTLTPAKTEILLREAAARGLARMKDIPPYRLTPPYNFSVATDDGPRGLAGDDLLETYRRFCATFFKSDTGWPEYNLRET